MKISSYVQAQLNGFQRRHKLIMFRLQNHVLGASQVITCRIQTRRLKWFKLNFSIVKMLQYLSVRKHSQRSSQPSMIRIDQKESFYPRGYKTPSSCSIWHGLQRSPTVGSPHSLQSCSFTSSANASNAGLIFSMERKTVNNVPACLCSIRFSRSLMSFLKAV